VTEESLTQKFGEHGTVVSARVVSDRETGRSRGFGFVDVEDADAQKVVAAMNGYQWDGRAIVVNEARPKTEGRGDRGDRRPRSFSRG
jgi:RNA recognition motif-containing protein